MLIHCLWNKEILTANENTSFEIFILAVGADVLKVKPVLHVTLIFLLAC